MSPEGSLLSRTTEDKRELHVNGFLAADKRDRFKISNFRFASPKVQKSVARYDRQSTDRTIPESKQRVLGVDIAYGHNRFQPSVAHAERVFDFALDSYTRAHTDRATNASEA
jgi:hypothetical protein